MHASARGQFASQQPIGGVVDEELGVADRVIDDRY
jgi:hypothetical protein